MDKPKSEPDPFASLITANCHVTPSQQALLRTAPFARQHERFPSESDSSYSIPVETTGIRMESPPEDEFLTPQEDSLPPASSPEPPPQPPVIGSESAATVDLHRDLESIGFGIARSTVVIESGMGTEVLGCDTDEFVVMERETRRMLEEGRIEPERKRLKVSEGLDAFRGASVGTVVVDWDGDQVFDQMPVRNQEVRMGLSGNTSISTADLGEDREFLVRKRGSEMRLSKNASIEAVDLDEDHDLPVRERELKMGPCENISIEVDLDENETCSDMPMRSRKVELGPTENTSTEVDWDEDELYGDLTTRNLVGEVGPSEGGEVRIDGNKGLSKKVTDPKGDENCQNGISIGVSREQRDDLSLRKRETKDALNKGGELCRDENRGFAEKGVQKINNFKHVAEKGISIGRSRETYGDLPPRNQEVENVPSKGDEPCRDGNRGFAKKGIDLPKGSDSTQKDKGVVESRELPPALRMLADIALGKDNDPCRGRKRGFVEENRNKVEKLKCVGQTSRSSGGLRDLPSSISGQEKNDRIMENILGALELITGGEKEKVRDDGSDEEADIVEIAMFRGMTFARPRWWPPEEFDD